MKLKRCQQNQSVLSTNQGKVFSDNKVKPFFPVTQPFLNQFLWLKKIKFWPFIQSKSSFCTFLLTGIHAIYINKIHKINSTKNAYKTQSGVSTWFYM